MQVVYLGGDTKKPQWGGDPGAEEEELNDSCRTMRLLCGPLRHNPAGAL